MGCSIPDSTACAVGNYPVYDITHVLSFWALFPAVTTTCQTCACHQVQSSACLACMQKLSASALAESTTDWTVLGGHLYCHFTATWTATCTSCVQIFAASGQESTTDGTVVERQLAFSALVGVLALTQQVSDV
jgi:hypothetical protein